MKKLLALVLCLLLTVQLLPVGFFTFKASAATSGNTGNCIWEVVNDTLTIRGDGSMSNYNSVYFGESDAPWSKSIKNVVIADGVTSIGEYAFAYCESLTSVTIPDSVTSIGAYAFAWCRSLTSITIPDSVTSIGSSAFYSCSSLTSVTYNAVNCTTMGPWDYSVFFGCSKLTTVVIGNQVQQIPAYAFARCDGLTSITIPDSVTSIGDYAFAWCDGLTGITIPDSVTSIGDYAFCLCDSLTSITIPDSVTSIGDDAFAGCSSLTGITVAANNPAYCSVDGVLFSKDQTTLLQCPRGKSGAYIIPSSVTSIGNSAFCDCSKLTSITIPDSVTSIGDYAFDWCRSLTSITIPDSVTSIGYEAFRDCDSLTSITIPDSVTSIGINAFKDCSSLTSVTVGDGALYIGSGAFASNGNLEGVQLGSGVTSIGDTAFEYCDSLETVVMPGSVTQIVYNAFNGCGGLLDVYYAGSQSQGNGIELDFGNEELLGATWHYNVSPATCPGHLFSNDCDMACDLCGALRRVGEHIYEHASDVTCNTCGKLRYISYTVTDGKAIITGADRSISGDFVIPSTLDGYPVTSIGDYAFAWCSSLTGITIPDSVTSIGDCAFYDCSKLTSITIPDNVTSIGDEAFRDCSSLTSVTYNAVNCTSMGSSSYPVFSGCSKLKTVTIGSRVQSIPADAFYDCSLTGVYITDLSAWCGIDFVNVHANPLCYSGNLYLNGSLVTNLVVPQGVTAIKPFAFYECSRLTSVTIPDSVTSIGNYAFYWCSSLTGITIPDSVTSIGDYAFCLCSSLTKVYYTGSAVQRGQISIGSDNTALTDAAWHYNSCKEDAHTYDNACDTTCNACEWTRTVEPHDFSHNCGYTCAVCGKSNRPAAPGVALLGTSSVRLVIYAGFEYSKDGMVWQDSPVFDGLLPNTAYTFYQRVKASASAQQSAVSAGTTVITAAEQAACTHRYDDDDDTACNECGEVRAVADATAPTLTVQGATVMAGKQVQLQVLLAGNPGFTYLELTPSYPANWTMEVQNGALVADLTQGKQLVWVADENMTDDGLLITLVFTVPQGTAVGEYDIGFTVRGCYNYDEEEVSLSVMSGTVTVIDFIYGDANGDGTIDGRDVTRLKKYLANYDYDAETSSIEIGKGADANGDGTIDGRDVTRLKKYLANYDYDTDTSTVVLGPNK